MTVASGRREVREYGLAVMTSASGHVPNGASGPVRYVSQAASLYPKSRPVIRRRLRRDRALGSALTLS